MKIEAGTSRWSAVISARTLTLFVGSSVKVVDDPPARKGVNPYQKVKWKNQTATGINDEKTVFSDVPHTRLAAARLIFQLHES